MWSRTSRRGLESETSAASPPWSRSATAAPSNPGSGSALPLYGPPGATLGSAGRKGTRPEEQVVGLNEVAAPEVVGVVLDEGRPRLAATATLADGAHVLLHGPFADLDPELQELAPDPFGTPQSVLGRHLPDQADGLGADSGFDVPGMGSP